MAGRPFSVLTSVWDVGETFSQTTDFIQFISAFLEFVVMPLVLFTNNCPVARSEYGIISFLLSVSGNLGSFITMRRMQRRIPACHPLELCE
jgi:hypothetical protein